MKKITLLLFALAFMSSSLFANLYVAGSFNSWTANDAGYMLSPMPDNASAYFGLFTFLNPGTYDFKITDGTWDNSTQGNNRRFVVTTPGIVAFFSTSVDQYVCSHEPVYLVGPAITGDWNFATTNPQLSYTFPNPTATWTGTVSEGEYKIVRVDATGVVLWNEFGATNLYCCVSGTQTATLDLMNMSMQIGTSSERFGLSYGVDDGSSWNMSEFTVNATEANLFELPMTIPADFSTLSCYVGYNNNTPCAPGFITGKSLTVLMSSVPGIQSGDGTFLIYKDSGDMNWYLAFVPSSPVATATSEVSALRLFVDNKRLMVNFEGEAQIALYSVGGQLVDQTLATSTYQKQLPQGIYILRVGSESHKIVVK